MLKRHDTIKCSLLIEWNQSYRHIGIITGVQDVTNNKKIIPYWPVRNTVGLIFMHNHSVGEVWVCLLNTWPSLESAFKWATGLRFFSCKRSFLWVAETTLHVNMIPIENHLWYGHFTFKTRNHPLQDPRSSRRNLKAHHQAWQASWAELPDWCWKFLQGYLGFQGRSRTRVQQRKSLIKKLSAS